MYFRVFSGVVFGAMTVGETMSMLPNYQKAKVSAKKVFTVITSTPKIDAYSEKGTKVDAVCIIRVYKRQNNMISVIEAW